MLLNVVTGDHSFMHSFVPVYRQCLTTAFGKIVCSSVVVVLAFRSGILGSNSVRSVFFCYAFVHLFLCYGLSS